MHDAAQVLVGKHDFSTFRASLCQAQSPVKTLTRLDVSRAGEEIDIIAEARSFLHHQVRNMVGTLRLVGEGKWSKADLRAALGSPRPHQGRPDRAAAGALSDRSEVRTRCLRHREPRISCRRLTVPAMWTRWQHQR